MVGAVRMFQFLNFAKIFRIDRTHPDNRGGVPPLVVHLPHMVHAWKGYFWGIVGRAGDRVKGGSRRAIAGRVDRGGQSLARWIEGGSRVDRGWIEGGSRRAITGKVDHVAQLFNVVSLLI